MKNFACVISFFCCAILCGCSFFSQTTVRDTRPSLTPILETPTLYAHYLKPHPTQGVTTAFSDIRGRDYQPAPWYNTQLETYFDDQNLYFKVQLSDPHLCASLTQRDTIIFFDNDFEFFFDPDRDNHAYGELEINALNTAWDLLLTKPYKDQGLAINAWDIGHLKTRVELNGTLNHNKDTDQSWVLYVQIPFKSLGALGVNGTPKDGDVWHVNFSRVQWHYTLNDKGSYTKIPHKPEENWVWSPTGIVAIHHPERWGKLVFRKDPKSEYIRPTYPREFAALHEVYYAQVAYYENFKCYASSMNQLSRYFPMNIPEDLTPSLEMTSHGWKASLTLPKGSPEKEITIIQDARVEYLK